MHTRLPKTIDELFKEVTRQLGVRPLNLEIRAYVEVQLRLSWPDLEADLHDQADDILETAVQQAELALDLCRRLQAQAADPSTLRAEAEPSHTAATVSAHEPVSSSMLGDYEAARSWAVCVHLADLASRHDDVRQIKAAICAGGTLSPDVATSFLDFPDGFAVCPQQPCALDLLPLDVFKANGIPVVGHHSEVEVVGGDLMEWHSNRVLEGLVSISWSSNSLQLPFRLDRTEDQTEPLLLFGRGYNMPFRLVWPGSVFDELRQVAAAVAHQYHWQAGDAVWFILTGEVPWIAPVTWKRDPHPRDDHDWGRIVVSFDPAVNVEVIRRVCLEAQRQVLGSSSNRSRDMRTLTVFQFVTIQRQANPRVTWRELVERWNRSYPNDTFDGERNFCGYYRRARESLTRRYRWGLSPHAMEVMAHQRRRKAPPE